MSATVLFVICVLLISYVIFGYPLVLSLLARFQAHPVAKTHQSKSVSVVIPVHNGGRYLTDKIRSVLSLDYPRELIETFVVSDGSTDDTAAIAKGFASEGVRLLEIARGGKCAALNAAIPQTKGQIVLLTDVRQILAPDSLQYLVNCFADPSVGVVSGDIIIRGGTTHAEADIGLYWRFESWVRESLSAIDSMFGANGPLYAICRDLIVPLPADILLDDVFLPLSAFRRGYRLIIESRARAFDYPTSLQTEFRRKVRTLGGNYQILRVYPWLLGPGNRMWFHFVSYKVGRLMLPWFIIVATTTSIFLPNPWPVIAVSLLILFCALAAVEPWMHGSALKRISSALRTFIVMMFATVLGLSVFFVPPRTLWKEATTNSNGIAWPSRKRGS